MTNVNGLSERAAVKVNANTLLRRANERRTAHNGEKMSPTERTKHYLESDGWMVGIVEKFNHHVKIRQDLWGFADLIASKAGCSATLIQVCVGSTHAEHKAKILREERAHRWLRAAHSILLISWSKKSIHEGVSGWPKQWEPRIEEITLQMFQH